MMLFRKMKHRKANIEIRVLLKKQEGKGEHVSLGNDSGEKEMNTSHVFTIETAGH